jgi:hypothetical protein
MAKQDDIQKTDPSEIEALIQRLKQSNLEPRESRSAGMIEFMTEPPKIKFRDRRRR